MAARENTGGGWIRFSDRVRALPPYLFIEIDRAKRAARARGADIIDFGVGDPDTPTPPFVIKAFNSAVRDPRNHKYPLDFGHRDFRLAAARWYSARFGVKLDPDREILPLIGSKEGLTHMPLAFINPGDRVLVPDPAYPAYRSGVLFAGGVPVTLPLHEKNGFLPDWKEVEKGNLSGVRMMYLNYPNNPTSAVANAAFFKRTVEFAQARRIIVCHDNAYSEIYEGRKKPTSFLAVEGAREVGVEFHSLSKTFNMTGWRLGFVCGNARLIEGLAKIKSNVDSGVFSAIQLAGAAAIGHSAAFTRKMNGLYDRRRKLLVTGLRKLSFKVFAPTATFYVWTRLPGGGSDSMGFSKHLLERAGIVATPGDGFGSLGKGYVRFTLTVPEPRIREALERMKKVAR